MIVASWYVTGRLVITETGRGEVAVVVQWLVQVTIARRVRVRWCVVQ